MTVEPPDRRAAAARFADDAVWSRTEDSAWVRTRIDALLSDLPGDLRSVLEVGCGDGKVLREVRRRLGAASLLVGIDRARPGLLRVGAAGRALLADADALPFGDRSFDLAICSEVLEHLPGPVLEGAFRELQRVARREILLSVPDRENLAQERMRCPRCGAEFQAWGHLHRFDLGMLDGLLPGFERVAARTAGPRHRCHPAILSLRHKLGCHYHDETAICPGCGNRDFPKRDFHPLRLLCDALDRIVALGRRPDYWLIARYRRRRG
jgi:SAM-dependent methyltransferase